MTYRRALLAPVLAAALVGCSSQPGQVASAVKVTGTVTFADGRPAKDLLLVLQPTQTGHPASFKLAADGRFQGDVVPGKYSYSVQPYEAGTERTKSLVALKQVPEKYRALHLDHQVDFKSSTEVQIKLN